MPAYNLVRTQAQTVIQDEVSKHQSLTIHTKRNLIEENVKVALQESLDETDNGAFTITRVAVRQVLTDASIEDAIRKVVQAQKEDEAMNFKLDVAKKQAQLNESLNRTYTPAYLQHEYNMALQTCAENEKCTMVVGLESAQPLLNMR
jgi:regulator of protease activity HflC (stomatin/prohibitin superfamily)